jgi:hypothetical protein
MTPSTQDLLALYRSQGLSPRDARIQALVRGVIGEENEKAANGLTYDDDRVRIAQVHARDDIILLSAQLRELLATSDAQVTLLRQIRWLLLALVIVFVLRSL